jgi:hypothetical protein
MVPTLCVGTLAMMLRVSSMLARLPGTRTLSVRGWVCDGWRAV